MKYHVVIPARYASTRLPGKPLLEIAGKPLLQHVYESACRSRADSVIIATDDERIRALAEDFGAPVCMTAASHQSGTERLAEVVTQRRTPEDTVIVNLQGDEFGMPTALLDQVAALLPEPEEAVMATLCEPLEDVAGLQDPNIVKVVFNRAGEALYFSRAPIPAETGADTQQQVKRYRHLGLYAYRAGFLKQYVALPPCDLERVERLEQLRVLDHGYRIRIAVACDKPGMGIDTPEDLERARQST